MWEVEFTDEFEAWWDTLSEKAQEDIAAVVELGLREQVMSLALKKRKWTSCG